MGIDELNLILIHGNSDKAKTTTNLNKLLMELEDDEIELRELTQRVIEVLKNISDTDYKEIISNIKLMMN